MNDHEHDAGRQGPLEEARRLPRSIEPPRDLWPGIKERIKPRVLPFRRALALAAAAGLLVLAARALLPRRVGWVIEREAGRPLVGAQPLDAPGRVRVGQWIVTADSSVAVVQVGRIGRVAVKPGSRVQVLATRPTDHRLPPVRGPIRAPGGPPPRAVLR